MENTVVLVLVIAANVIAFKWVMHDLEQTRDLLLEKFAEGSSATFWENRKQSLKAVLNDSAVEANVLRETVADLRKYITSLQLEIRNLRDLAQSTHATASRQVRCTVLPSLVQQELHRIVHESEAVPIDHPGYLVRLKNFAADRFVRVLAGVRACLPSESFLFGVAVLVVVANLFWLVFTAMTGHWDVFANFRLSLCACFGSHSRRRRPPEETDGNRTPSPRKSSKSARTSEGSSTTTLKVNPSKLSFLTTDEEKLHLSQDETTGDTKKHSFSHSERKCVSLRNMRERRMVMFLKHFQVPPNPDTRDIANACRTVKVIYPGKEYCFTIENYGFVEDLWAIVVYEDDETGFCLNAAYEEEHFSGWVLTEEGVLVNGEVLRPWKSLNYSTADQVRTKVEHNLDGAAAGAPTTISIGTHFR